MMGSNRPIPIEQITLGGLLHDIGKFSLRAGVAASRDWDEEARAAYRYKHALLSADFVQTYVPTPWRQHALRAAAYHHRPQQHVEKVVALADWLASAERTTGGDDASRQAHPSQQMSVFCTVQTTGADGKPQRAPGDRYLPLAPLSVTREAIFPQPALDRAAAWEAYAALWDSFTTDAALLRDAHEAGGNLAVYLEHLQLLLQKYTWCVPAATFDARPDVSLYDHSRMCAALAAVLARQEMPADRLDALMRAPQQGDTPLALLVGGDISGVQDFIYTITARGATAALRGRSFYLQLLTDAVARYVLRRLDLPLTSLIYAGGGNFYLLATPADAAVLVDIQREISRILLGHHRGALYLALGSKPLAGRDFFDGALADAWSGIHTDFRASKQRRFAELGDAIVQLFVPQSMGSAEKLCSVCGLEHPDTVEVRKREEDGEETIRKCAPCRSYEALGEQLRRAAYLVYGMRAPDAADITVPGGYQTVLAALGLHAELFEKWSPRPPRQRETVYLLHDAMPAETVSATAERAVGRRLLVNVTPTLSAAEHEKLRRDGFDEELPVAESIKPFSVMAHQSRGIHRLGVLRLDVDNLGALFADGLGRRATLSRIAALSFAISLFFEGWIEAIARRGFDTKGGERLYSIYSGGDDLFFVGSWDGVVQLAQTIRTDLEAYVAGHPGITVSGGIALVPAKYPLYQAASDAAEAEHAAKALRWWDEGRPRRKDALTFLGQPLPWRQFGPREAEAGFDSVTALKALMVARDKKEAMPLLRRLSDIYRQYETLADARRQEGRDRNRAGAPQPVWGPYMYRGVYALERLARSGNDAVAGDLRRRLEDEQFVNMAWIGLAARWAELELRET